MENKEDRFRSIVAENDRKIRGICRYYAPSDEDQKDMYQEILINIWKSLEKFRGDSQISTWIYRIAVNTSLNYAGKHYKLLRLNVDPQHIGLLTMLQDDEGQATEQEAQIEKLQMFLNQLNVIDKAIMGLVLDELPTREIADIIGITEPNVRVKIHRIKETLRHQMKGGQHE
jgi:RNA polymerase sigma-70 factor (ECF subfamily)